MTNGTAQSMNTIYRAAVIVLFAVLCYLGSNIYGKIDRIPAEYVTLERYRCDLDKIERGLDLINRKLDHFIAKDAQ